MREITIADSHGEKALAIRHVGDQPALGLQNPVDRVEKIENFTSLEMLQNVHQKNHVLRTVGYSSQIKKEVGAYHLMQPALMRHRDLL